MSWQAYVDDHLLAPIKDSTNKLTSAAILGHDGSVWAQSANFPQLSGPETASLIAGFNDAGTLAQNGLFMGGAKYMVIQGEAGAVIRGKKGQGGCTIKKTGMAIVVGLYDEPVQPGDCNIVVENMGDYLIGQGY
eukprot:TRINITY_DN20808_c0_g1_i1.p1 TRINITY_DN20808_c0_g1~~TRINITY_DN20808_c0_g1_i1.p1  ORF type:complete len:134 (-),score=28.48 TRINITY_DN20808_c0_g1_i1:658-1059(-)